MPTGKDLREHIRDLLWSQWHELGVSTTVPRRHSEDCIDPEPLIAFTAAHSDLDARLRDEAIDWSLQYGTYVSRARLKNVLRGWGALQNGRFRVFAATVNAHGRSGWPAEGATAITFRPRSRSLLVDLNAPALLSLRVRAVFGVGARAELIRAFLARPESALTAAELATETSYGKRNVLNELEALRFAGVVKSFRAVNADRFLLAKAEELSALLTPLPRHFTRWTPTFGVLGAILQLVRESATRSDLLNAVEAQRLLDDRKDLFAAAGIYPPPLPKSTNAWPAFVEWTASRVRALARA